MTQDNFSQSETALSTKEEGKRGVVSPLKKPISLTKKISKALLSLFFFSPLTLAINFLVAVLILVGCFLFHQKFQNYTLMNYVLPALERFDIIKIQAQDIHIDIFKEITVKEIKIYDDEDLFIEIQNLKTEPKNIINIFAGFKSITADTVTIHKKPKFEKFKPENPDDKEIIPSLPFDIFDISINQLILMPKLTRQDKPLNMKVSGTTDFITHQALHLTAILKDYENAMVKADIIKKDTNQIALDTSIEAPAHLINSLIKEKFFSKQVTIKAKGDIIFQDDSGDKMNLNFPSFSVKDGKRLFTGHIKTHLTSKPFQMTSTILNIQSSDNSLRYAGDIFDNAFEGRLTAKTFNVTDFYPINPLLSRLLVDGDMKIKGDYHSMPSVTGTLKANSIYDNMPLDITVSGKHEKNNSVIKVNLSHQKSDIIIGDVSFDNKNKKGTAELRFSPTYFPQKIVKQLSVLVGSSSIKTDFMQVKQGIIFNKGLAKIDSLVPKQPIQDYDVVLKNIQFNFSGLQDALSVNNLSMITKINNAEYHTQGDISLYEQHKPKNVNLTLVSTQDAKEKIALSLKHQDKDLVSLKIDNFNPNKVKPNLLGVDIDKISGTFSGTADDVLNNPMQTLMGNYSVGFYHSPQDFSPFYLTATGKINHGDLTGGHYRITQNQKEIGAGTFASTNNFNTITVNAKNDMKMLSSLFEESPHQLAGDMRLEMTIKNAIPSGTLRINNATYHDVVNDIQLKDIMLDARIYNDYVDVKKFSANSLPKGSIVGEGRISLSENVQSDFKLVSQRFSVQNNMINLRADSELKLKGNANNYQLGGMINITNLMILLPDLKSQTIPKLNIVEAEQSQEVSKNIPFLSKIATDMNIFIKEGSKITGFGIEGFPKGSLRIYNTLAEPYIDGIIEVARGSIEVFGKKFKITEGGINFKKTTPFMNITAMHRIDDRDISLKFKGLIDNPELEFTAVPAIAKDEIIALLIYGKDKKNLSPFQALRLGTALYQLSRGKSNSNSKYDVIGKTERLLNVDELSINSGSNNSVTVGAGKYIDDDIYVATDYNPVLGESIFRLELRLTETLQLESVLNTSVNSPNQTEIMLKRRQDY